MRKLRLLRRLAYGETLRNDGLFWLLLGNTVDGAEAVDK